MILECGETDLANFIVQNAKTQKALYPLTVRYLWSQMVAAVNAMHQEGG